MGTKTAYPPAMKNITITGEISKVDSDKRQAFGWASITEIDGSPVVDLQDDVIKTEELEKAAYDYVLSSRVGGEMHKRSKGGPKQIGTLIESVVLTPEKIAKMGLPAGTHSGWWVGFKVHDDKVWKSVKDGKYGGFSIHGKGYRKTVDESEIGKNTIQVDEYTRSDGTTVAAHTRSRGISGAIDATLAAATGALAWKYAGGNARSHRVLAIGYGLYALGSLGSALNHFVQGAKERRVPDSAPQLDVAGAPPNRTGGLITSSDRRLDVAGAPPYRPSRTGGLIVSADQMEANSQRTSEDLAREIEGALDVLEGRVGKSVIPDDLEDSAEVLADVLNMSVEDFLYELGNEFGEPRSVSLMELAEFMDKVDRRINKHLIGRHDQKDHDPTKGKKSLSEGHSRSDHDRFSTASGAVLGGLAGGYFAGPLGAVAGGLLGAHGLSSAAIRNAAHNERLAEILGVLPPGESPEAMEAFNDAVERAIIAEHMGMEVPSPDASQEEKNAFNRAIEERVEEVNAFGKSAGDEMEHMIVETMEKAASASSSGDEFLDRIADIADAVEKTYISKGYGTVSKETITVQEYKRADGVVVPQHERKISRRAAAALAGAAGTAALFTPGGRALRSGLASGARGVEVMGRGLGSFGVGQRIGLGANTVGRGAQSFGSGVGNAFTGGVNRVRGMQNARSMGMPAGGGWQAGPTAGQRFASGAGAAANSAGRFGQGFVQGVRHPIGTFTGTATNQNPFAPLNLAGAAGQGAGAGGLIGTAYGGLVSGASELHNRRQQRTAKRLTEREAELLEKYLG